MRRRSTKLKLHIEDIKKMLDEGISANRIAKKYGVSQSGVIQFLYREGLWDMNIPQEEEDRVLKYYKQSESIVKLAQLSKVIKYKVKAILEKHGLPIPKYRYTEQVIKLLQEGKLTHAEIAKKVGCSCASISIISRDFGLSGGIAERTMNNHKNEIIKLFQRGVPHREIGEKFNVSHKTIERYMSKWGYKEYAKNKYVSCRLKDRTLEGCINRCLAAVPSEIRTEEYYDHFIHDAKTLVIYSIFQKSNYHPIFKPSIDHIVPKSQGGTNDLENLRIVPYWYNVVKLNFPDEQIRDLLASDIFQRSLMLMIGADVPIGVSETNN